MTKSQKLELLGRHIGSAMRLLGSSAEDIQLIDTLQTLLTEVRYWQAHRVGPVEDAEFLDRLRDLLGMEECE